MGLRTCTIWIWNACNLQVMHLLHCRACYLQFTATPMHKFLQTMCKWFWDSFNILNTFAHLPRSCCSPTQILSAKEYFQSALMSYTTHINGLLGGVLQYVVSKLHCISMQCLVLMNHTTNWAYSRHVQIVSFVTILVNKHTNKLKYTNKIINNDK